MAPGDDSGYFLMMIKIKSLSLLILVAATFACGDNRGRGVAPGTQPTPVRQSRAAAGQLAYADTFPQAVDHQGGSFGSIFPQRYFLDSTLAKGGEAAPVLLWICAEGPCSAEQMQAALATHAQKLGAHMVALEHRFYGKSFPMPDLTTPSLRVLTVEQALADLQDFVEFMQGVEGLSGKWVAFGGSYSGALAAFFRATRPELVTAAVSSSGPVRAKEDFEEYDAHIAGVLGSECAANMREVVAGVDATLDSDAAGFAKLRKLFGATSEDKNYFGTLLAFPLGNMAQYGIPSKKQVCDAVAGAKPLEAYAALVANPSNETLGMGALSLLANDGSDVTNTELPDEGVAGGRMFLYQGCTQLGYWPVAHEDRSLSVFSKYETVEYYRSSCAYLFSRVDPPDTEITNQRYYARLQSGETTRVLYTNGSEDPWSELSITTPPAGSEAYMIEGGHHCDDVQAPAVSDSASLQGARAKISATISGWLK